MADRRIPRRWQRRISILAIALFLIFVAVDKATAAPIHDRLARDLYAIAGEKFTLDCTYAGRTAYAVAYPRYKQLAPIVYARPSVCRDANTFMRTGRVTSNVGLALLVLVHEAQHIAGVTNEADAEWIALETVGAVAERLRPGTGETVNVFAHRWHEWLVARFPEYERP